jgi:hypothetical protein
MDRIYHKPYLAELYGASPAERVFVYPREDMAAAANRLRDMILAG